MKHLELLLAVLLLLCLLPMSYGYYELVRFVSMVAFAFMAYKYCEEKKDALAVAFGGLALLFQPFVKIALGRTVWNVVVAVLLVLLWFKDLSDKRN